MRKRLEILGNLGNLGLLGNLGNLGLLGSLGHLERLGRLALLVALLGFVAACGGASREELASLAAKGYYTHLIHGEYEQFFEGMDQRTLPGDSTAQVLSADSAYRSQMLDNLRQFMARQEKEHHGILEVRVSNAATDTVQQFTNVFLVLCFGDSTNEEIVVPMVERNGSWRMK